MATNDVQSDGSDSELEDFSQYLSSSAAAGSSRQSRDTSAMLGITSPSTSAFLADQQTSVSMDSECAMECGCCFADTPLDDMVQCSDCHLFCLDCLKRYAEESIHGQGKSELLCMTADCGAPFPRTMLERALTKEVLAKFDERVQEESLNMANLENLVRCPGCNFAAEIADPNQMVFVCLQCEKRTCKKCHVDWSEHEGLACSQVEKKDETSIRTRYEELMSEAKIRNCPKCKAPIVKDGGCNRVTCRCGGSICYICREPNIQYDHFCQHPGPHRNGCKKCTRCFLWSDAEEDDKRAIEQLKAQGKLERDNKGFTENKEIGAPNAAERGGINTHPGQQILPQVGAIRGDLRRRERAAAAQHIYDRGRNQVREMDEALGALRQQILNVDRQGAVQPLFGMPPAPYAMQLPQPFGMQPPQPFGMQPPQPFGPAPHHYPMVTSAPTSRAAVTLPAQSADLVSGRARNPQVIDMTLPTYQPLEPFVSARVPLHQPIRPAQTIAAGSKRKLPSASSQGSVATAPSADTVTTTATRVSISTPAAYNAPALTQATPAMAASDTSTPGSRKLLSTPKTSQRMKNLRVGFTGSGPSSAPDTSQSSTSTSATATTPGQVSATDRRLSTTVTTIASTSSTRNQDVNILTAGPSSRPDTPYSTSNATVHSYIDGSNIAGPSGISSSSTRSATPLISHAVRSHEPYGAEGSSISGASRKGKMPARRTPDRFGAGDNHLSSGGDLRRHSIIRPKYGLYHGEDQNGNAPTNLPSDEAFQARLNGRVHTGPDSWHQVEEDERSLSEDRRWLATQLKVKHEKDLYELRKKMEKEREEMRSTLLHRQKRLEERRRKLQDDL